MRMRILIACLAAIPPLFGQPAGKSASDTTGALEQDSLTSQENVIKVKESGVAFLGLESKAENRFHETLEERIYLKLSYNKSIELADKDFYYKAKSRGFVTGKLVPANEAVRLMKVFGERIYVSGEIRDYRIEMRRIMGILPFGKVYGEIICYLQVYDALENEPRFAGNLKFIGEMNARYIGYGNNKGVMPLSPMEEKHFMYELVNGMGNTFAETAEASYIGLLDKKARKVLKRGAPPTKRQVITPRR
ncbi:MAG: hypothetical protein A2487_14870 [Candidatus Raymondbacteria bacterium RifOxyC12_full_50_8]|uniref:Uncharacterized protein n=1 Tax=Candidatus Raymondbacteria bacterium RIFOXYD12_FULL_49_13 TaxID=1817890 RepID=A0A1F7FLS5_UNCRA|nr:MAG: hypothetical protein A2248_15830 [Candidatus Raymondbacteria bacterium RIFOXYA2_FULL_49_16]OGJ96087.1 MAG: hypothetical protein A2453_08370 [Candidatus Raymondbacteria bacterium RIFOXYC2_FULL_50_21]OGK01439.1 MAG: hypothetical protein A2487_14870 [Candidatus Raymondbacteria bacterium RifOxyC12_full_50_8]OGK01858.1 MAG: hypothetical protein A2350_00840 [Candidatus Raymondbacteria bacterium RifOxyB12_full_50_8]OGK07620.1 MAG: hypothetical protein A2519_21895 [Candidatus Raymondbacteria ba